MSESKGFRVGYALPSKKVQTVVQPSLVDHAKQKGVDLVAVDLTKPLVDQGFFNCIVHKLYGQDWNEQLEEYSCKYPDSVIIDQPERIERLHSRRSMLEVVSRLKIAKERWGLGLGVPKQVVVVEEDEAKKSVVELGDLKLPVIAKPLLANGSEGSHEMYLVTKKKGLEKLRTPWVMQEFANHGGVVFKVYVAGEQVKCVKRRSLPDITVSPDSGEEDEEKGLMAFSQISNSSEIEDEEVEKAEMPSVGFVEAVGRALRQELGLHLFNFDLIKDCRGPLPHDTFLVIDINYFPGYAKLPCFQHFFTDFFLQICQPTPPTTTTL